MTDYELIIKQMEALADESDERVPLMANVSALLFYSMEDINWAGFYTVSGGELILGSFQGKVACVRIGKGRGVCGTAWEKDEVQVVPDVHQFPGHIACDSDSMSEIVVPVHQSGKDGQNPEVTAVLDIDSPIADRFSEDDREGLTALVRALEKLI